MRLACQHASNSPRPPPGGPEKEMPPFSEKLFFGHDLTSFCPNSSWCASFHRESYIPRRARISIYNGWSLYTQNTLCYCTVRYSEKTSVMCCYPLCEAMPAGTSPYTDEVAAFDISSRHQLPIYKKHRLLPNSAQLPVLPSISIPAMK